MPVISTIIPVFNCWSLTEACLRSLAQYSAGYDQEVIVVDNASTDATAVSCPELGKTLFGDNFHYLRQPYNRNFGPACNIGARHASSDTLFFLNNDTLLTPGWLPPLLNALHATTTPSLVGPLLLHPQFFGFPDRVQHLGVAVSPYYALEDLFEGFPADHPACRVRRPLQILTAAAFMIPKTYFLDNGAFHEGFINGFEDVELCLRLKARGAQMLCIPDSRIYHLVSRTPGRHSHGEENGRLLHQLAEHLLRPDLCQFFTQQGYTPALSPMLSLYPRLTDSRRQALETRYRTAPDALEDLLQEEPLWLEGYTYLAQQLAQKGDYTAAIQTLNLSYYFSPHPQTILTMTRLAARSGHAALQQHTKELLAENVAVQLPNLITEAALLCKLCLQHHDSTVVALYDAWFREAPDLLAYFPSNGLTRGSPYPPYPTSLAGYSLWTLALM